MLSDATRARTIVFLLRLSGTIMVTAFLAILLPVDWMAATHRWLGLGQFPESPIVDYLARTIAALYGFHGVLLLILATDPVRYRQIVSYVVVMNVLFGSIVIGVDVHAGLPLFWTMSEGPPIVMFGLVLGWLNKSSER
jgi:hypothetical protein